ncbi:PREDICTED: uncharacterized protein LOC109230394 [Nicotiana attenuata]|uniref:SAWADEE domain-containing protein n=1 Tax=Nicotiana attenuata TaxID=49451 RepID=A0A1J6IQN8_NICAT|nr:PREDICTED: uncharacterized protein LOC109230394 [Nicotiana attenuata]OIT00047.1 hypothetical protein A4A49_22040 [Nicotiana attenuata]
MANPGQREGYNLEYRYKVDDSWYSVRLVLKGQRLTVKYEGYPEEVDTIFDVGDFTSKEEVDEFVERFRCVSPQLQDRECCTLKEGMIVCVACNAFCEDDMLFYDVVIEAIHNVDHSFPNGEEECLCTFIISWLHGPKEGCLTATRIEGMCTIKGVAQVDPKIASFLKQGINSAKSIVGVTSGATDSSIAGIGNKTKILEGYTQVSISCLLKTWRETYYHHHSGILYMKILLFHQKYTFYQVYLCHMREVLLRLIVKRSFSRYTSFWRIHPTLLCPQLEGYASRINKYGQRSDGGTFKNRSIQKSKAIKRFVSRVHDSSKATL